MDIGAYLSTGALQRRNVRRVQFPCPNALPDDARTESITKQQHELDHHVLSDKIDQNAADLAIWIGGLNNMTNDLLQDIRSLRTLVWSLVAIVLMLVVMMIRK